MSAPKDAPPVPDMPPPGPPSRYDSTANLVPMSNYTDTYDVGYDYDDDDGVNNYGGTSVDVPRCVWIFIAALVVMFVIVSILSSTFFMKLFIFGGSYESVWNSMEPRMEDWDYYVQKEKENFPDLAALEEETGSCDDSSANQTMVAYQAQYESHLLSAMQQVYYKVCDLSEVDPNSPECINALAGNSTFMELYVIFEPIVLPDPPSPANITADFQDRLAARYEYDKNYVRDKLLRGPEISGFSFDVDAHVGTMNASLGDLQNLASTSIPDSALMSTIIGGLSGVGADAVSGLYVNMITMENRLAQLEGLNAELDVKVDEFQVGTLQGGIDGLPAIGLFGTDYDPPEVIDGSLVAALTDQEFSGPDVGAFNAANFTTLSGPDFFPDIPLPEISVALDILVAIESFYILGDVIFTLLRLRFRSPPAFKVVRKFGIQKYDASWDAKGKAYKCFGKCVGKFRPVYLYALIGLAIYLLFLWVYYHSLYAPIHDPESDVYDDDGPVSYRDRFWEARNFNELNEELARISNQCLEEKYTLSNQISNLENELLYNTSALRRWAEVTWEVQFNTPLFIFNDSGVAFQTQNETYICDCPQSYYESSYSDPRRQSAVAADVQFYIIMNAYVIKAHLFILAIVFLRVARSYILKTAILTLSRYRTPYLVATIRQPATHVTTIAGHLKPADFKETATTNWVNFTAEREACKEARDRQTYCSLIFLGIAIVMFFVVIAWNASINRQVDRGTVFSDGNPVIYGGSGSSSSASF